MATRTKTRVPAHQRETGAYGGPYAPQVNAAARANGLDPFWLAAVLWVENRFRPTGDSAAGAVGIAQIQLSAHPEVTRAQAENPDFAIPWAAQYLAALRRRAGGSLTTATKYYNTGPNAAPSTLAGAGTAYLDQVMAGYEQLRKSASKIVTSLAGGFLRPGALYRPGRSDQGRDFQTNAGAPLIAPGAGKVLAVLSDPSGFGPSYPIVQFETGPYAGEPPLYLGHTLSALPAGAHFKPGQVLAHTGRQPVGNASVPGWAEIGYAPNGSPGKMGQPAPFTGPSGNQLVSFTGVLKTGLRAALLPESFIPGVDIPGVGDIPGISDITGIASGLKALAAAPLKFLQDPAYPFLWLLFMVTGFALLYLGATRLFGVRPVRTVLAARGGGEA